MYIPRFVNNYLFVDKSNYFKLNFHKAGIAFSDTVASQTN